MQDNLKDVIEEVDINDAFEEILLSEEKVIEEGYKEGFSIGSLEDSIEGYHLGYHRGAEIGSEVGYYRAFVEYHLNDIKKSELTGNILKNLETLNKILEEFPQFNTDKLDLFELVERTRNLYKKICTQLKLKLDHKKEGLNF